MSGDLGDKVSARHIAARAQEEAMKHVLPFKQRQIEQRQFEALRHVDAGILQQRHQVISRGTTHGVLKIDHADLVDAFASLQTDQIGRVEVA